MKCFQLRADPYGKRLLIVVGISKSQLLKEIKRRKLRKSLYKEVDKEKELPTKADNAMIYIDEVYGNGIIYLSKWVFNAKWIGVLSHEINHFGVLVMKVVGTNIMKEDEPFCYTTEELLEKAITKLNK